VAFRSEDPCYVNIQNLKQQKMQHFRVPCMFDSVRLSDISIKLINYFAPYCVISITVRVVITQYRPTYNLHVDDINMQVNIFQ